MSGSSAPVPRGRLPESPQCPFCDGNDTELMNAFGSQLSVSTYWCKRCRSPFEFMKWIEPSDAVTPPAG
jgi:hypothetical protein